MAHFKNNSQKMPWACLFPVAVLRLLVGGLLLAVVRGSKSISDPVKYIMVIVERGMVMKISQKAIMVQ